ncbi:hypothetical protein ABVT39_022210 [Epinephelus coioides]
MTATSVEALMEKSNISSVRLINKVVEEVCAALPQPLRVFVENCALSDQWNDKCE